MDNKEIIELLERYNEGLCSPEEQALINTWYINHKGLPITESIDQLEKDLNEIQYQLEQHTKTKEIKLWPRIAAVAAAVALIVLGVYFFSAPRHSDAGQNPALAMNDIAPGKNGATITLANGKVIQLSDTKTGVVIGYDKLAYNDGSAVGSLSASGGEMPEGQRGGSAVAQTAKGQTYIFTLPDGTKVWLNAASSLTIPSDFSGTETRKVALTGEAYFEVTKNKAKPFIVASNGQEVTVLGTHFNISAYADEGSIKTTLLEGTVKVAAFGKTTPASPPPDRSGGALLPKEGTSIVLKPNQQSVVSGSNRIAVKEVDVNEAIAWKNGEFAFNSEQLSTIMRKVARWYNVDVVYQDNIMEMQVTGSISRFEKVSKVLEMLESTGELHFKIEGKKIIVSK